MTVALKNVDFQFLTLLKNLVDMNRNIKMYESEDNLIFDSQIEKMKQYEISFLDEVSAWRKEFGIEDNSVFETLEDSIQKVKSNECDDFSKIENIWS